MAHNLAQTNGKAEVFYFAEAPSHKLGTKLDNPATPSRLGDTARKVQLASSLTKVDARFLSERIALSSPASCSCQPATAFASLPLCHFGERGHPVRMKPKRQERKAGRRGAAGA